MEFSSDLKKLLFSIWKLLEELFGMDSLTFSCTYCDEILMSGHCVGQFDLPPYTIIIA